MLSGIQIQAITRCLTDLDEHLDLHQLVVEHLVVHHQHVHDHLVVHHQHGRGRHGVQDRARRRHLR